MSPGIGERIRVARIITRLNVGGPAQQAVILTLGLPQDRYDTFLIAGRLGPAEADLLELRDERRVRPHLVSSLRREISPLRDAVALWSLVRLLRRLRPHIVHTHTSKAGLLGRVAARVAGVPVVVHTFHGNVLDGYFGAAKTALFEMLERVLARLSTRIVAISATQAVEIRRRSIAGGARLVEVPLGLELGAFLDPPRGKLRAELAVGQQTPLVGIVARLVPIKRVDVFIDAAALVARERPDARFVIVGDGPLRPELERRAMETGIARAVLFLGWRADLAPIYADLDVVVQTSANEGTPVALIEALTAARPVVATNVGGVSDVVSPDCGLLVPPGDPASVARAIRYLLSEPATARRMGLAGRDRVYPAYDARTLIQHIDALYTALLVKERSAVN